MSSNKLTDKKSFLISFLILIATLQLISCKQSSQGENTENENVRSKASETKILCFKNEFPYPDDSGMEDVQELTVSIQGENVNGSYKWLPAEKDQRKGEFSGTIKGTVISAEYTFMQEGIEDSASITIELEDNQAIVKGGKPELGLSATINKVKCN